MSKRGAVTIYVAIAILIVAIGIFVASVVPKFRKPKVVEETWFKDYVEACIKQWLEGFVAKVNICQPSGQVSSPLCYNGIPFFCYNDRPGEDCKEVDPTIPLNEVLEQIKGNATMCIQNATTYLKQRGYDVTDISQDDLDVKFQATFSRTKVEININKTITIKKGGMAYSIKRFLIETKGIGLYWGAYEEFKDLVKAIVGNESVRDVSGNEIIKIRDDVCKGCGISVENIGNCDIKIYHLKKNNMEFTFAIRENEGSSCYL
jgi:hypothetical protein